MSRPAATTRLYLQDDHGCEAEATVVVVRDAAVACDRVVAIDGFDAQAYGGTHVGTTADLGASRSSMRVSAGRCASVSTT